MSSLNVKGNSRTVQLKAGLVDSDGYAPVADDIVALPEIKVFYLDCDTCDGPGDVTVRGFADGHGTENHKFEYSGSKWQYGLDTTNSTSPGTYQVQMISGDEAEYVIDPVCMIAFEIE